MNAIDLSADIGLAAVGLATLNICLGVLIAVRYSPVRCGPHRRVNIFRLHNWAGYLLLVSALLHPVVLLFNGVARFTFRDIALPLWSPVQPLENSIGAVALYLLLVVTATSYFRLRMTRRTWKRFHFLTYAAAATTFAHGVLTDPQLKGVAVDYLDGEKVFIEICGLAILAAGIYGAKRKSDRRALTAAPAGARRRLLEAVPEGD